MELAHQINVLDVVASNANLTTDAFDILPGSDVRLIVAITAIAGAPASVFDLVGVTDGGDDVTLATTALAVVGSATSLTLNCPRRLRFRLTQAGGANNITASVDLILLPPNLLS